MKIAKISIMCLALLMPGIITTVQAKCDCYEIISSKTTDPTQIQYQAITRYPQTIIYDSVTDFLTKKSVLKTRKVLVLGYDGYREDALENVLGMENSAIKEVMNEGGLYHSYAGADGNQETSTAPGWLSILSGRWANELGVNDNADMKSAEDKTFLDKATQFGYRSTFLASWAPHFDVTYREDIKNFNGEVIFQQMDNDEETLVHLNDVLADTSSESFDVIFATLEYTDHAGHSLGYGNQIGEYKGASQQVDRASYDLLQTIYQRDTYEDEDWLIIITTDHGGVGTNHGGQSTEEKNTWFVTNQILDSTKY